MEEADKRLFWFLKEDAHFDLKDSSIRGLYVQQILSRGRIEDVRRLLRILPWQDFTESIRRIGPFLPGEVRMFWEDFIASRQ